MVEAIGLAAFPLVYHLLPRLSDRGYCVSKPLGILLLGYVSWLLSMLHILPSVRITLLGIFLAMAAFSAYYLWRRRREFLTFARGAFVVIVVCEVIFLLMFAGWTAYRAYDPAIDHTEQPMDFAFLNASVRTSTGPPEDPWLRGESVSYYYFGYWILGVLTEMSGIASRISYNLSLALIPAMGASAIFGLVFNMARADTRRLRLAVIGGVSAAILLVGAANLEGVLEFARSNGMGSEDFWETVGIEGLDTPVAKPTQGWTPEEFWWWWRASRVISASEDGQAVDYTIQEFPFFSFMLGDLHPHVMSIPFVILFLVMCWNYLRAPPEKWSSLSLRRASTVLALGLTLGCLGFINMWDLPVFAAVLIGVVALKAYSLTGATLVQRLKTTVPEALVVIVAAPVFILPYLLTFTSQVTGIGAVAVTTRPLHMFIVWGLLLVAVTPFILVEFWRTTVDRDWLRLLLISLAVGFLPYVIWVFLKSGQEGTTGSTSGRLLHVLPLAILVSVAAYTTLWLIRKKGGPSRGTVFGLALSVVGLLLLMGPELLYVNDSFGGASERMNTVFKLYYQAWIVLAVVSGLAIYYWGSLRERLTGTKRFLTGVWAAVFLLLLAGSVYYPAAAAYSKGHLFHEGATLDGLAFLLNTSGAEYRAMEFVHKNAGPDSAILEAVGDDYSPHGRISASTGVPTVLGWQGHELQWRGSSEPFEGREQDVESIYQTQDVDKARELLDRYDVDFVYVGQRERSKYGADGLAKFESFMETVFSEGSVTVYRSTP